MHAEPWAAPVPTRDSHNGDRDFTTLANLFEEWAAETPENIALRTERTSTTYAELDIAAAEVADWLAHEGLGAGDCLAIALPVSTAFVVAAVGAAKAGVAYVSIDPASPPARVAEVVAATHAGALITADGARPAGVPAKVVTSPASVPPPRRGPAVPRRRPGPLDTALVIHTSGTTGSPRAVALAHRSLVGAVRSAGIRLGPGDLVPMLASVAFDASAFELWATLGRGATLVVPGSTDTVRQVIARYRVTGMLIASALFRTFVDDGGAAAADSLRWVLVGGEELSAAHVAAFLDEAGHCAVYNCYGPTETTVFATWQRVTRVHRGTRVPIGTATLGKRVHLMDDGLAPTPPGETGELFIAGAGLAVGYLGAPAETAQRFVPDPTTSGGGRMYRTGDLARRGPGGALEFVGRRDRQAKISGYRVDPAEVEAVLLRHPGVTHAVVTVQTRPNGRPALCAHVSGPARPPVAAVREWLTGELPHYLVPARIVVVDTMPLTRNGKVDRDALPAVWSARTLTEVEYLPPRTELQRTIAEIFCDGLGVADVGLNDNFFELGGDSLTGFELLSRIAAIAGVELTVRDLIENQTVAEMAVRVDAARGV